MILVPHCLFVVGAFRYLYRYSSEVFSLLFSTKIGASLLSFGIRLTSIGDQQIWLFFSTKTSSHYKVTCSEIIL
jgi:hypothetical protein